jgi:hypothetical protein
MAGRTPRRWQDIGRAHELLLEFRMRARSIQAFGPITEFLAKKAAERAPKPTNGTATL